MDVVVNPDLMQAGDSLENIFDNKTKPEEPTKKQMAEDLLNELNSGR